MARTWIGWTSATSHQGAALSLSAESVVMCLTIYATPTVIECLSDAS